MGSGRSRFLRRWYGTHDSSCRRQPFVARYGKLYRADLNSGQLNEVYSIEPDYKMRLFSDDSETSDCPFTGKYQDDSRSGRDLEEIIRPIFMEMIFVLKAIPSGLFQILFLIK